MALGREPVGFNWSYRDWLFALVIVFMGMAVFSLITSSEQKKTNVKPQGDLIFTLHWDHASDSDVDLWVLAPGDRPVGYSHPTDVHCNLVRDDLGRQEDTQSRNEEMTLCRGIAVGEYVVDVMAYDVYDHHFPVSATVSAVRAASDGMETIFRRTVKLEHDGQQITVARFSLDKGGQLVEGSINDLPMPLYGQ